MVSVSEVWKTWQEGFANKNSANSESSSPTISSSLPQEKL